jgi:anti-sigma regulatory factor (Ser/Thr protein kinase)
LAFAESTFKGYVILPATRFEDGLGQRNAVDRIVSAVLGSTRGINRRGIASFEWSIAEVTDNVLLHSQSSFGGLIQLSAYKRQSRRLEFIVVDSGVGIPNTLRQSKLKITSDTEAVDLSIKEGVTRDPELGQGNGLFGTYQVCKKSRGSFFLQSGYAKLTSGPLPGHSVSLQKVPFEGTIIAAQIDFSDPKLLANALQFGGKVHTPMDFVETHYEDWDRGEMHFKLSRETLSFRTRPGGVPVRNKLSNLLEMCPDQRVIVDFENIPLISSSFADEVFGKLCLEIGEKEFSNRVEFSNLTPLIKLLISRAVAQRLDSGTSEQVVE